MSLQMQSQVSTDAGWGLIDGPETAGPEIDATGDAVRVATGTAGADRIATRAADERG